MVVRSGAGSSSPLRRFEYLLQIIPMSGQDISVTKKRGRPKGPPTAVVRLPLLTVADAVKWAETQEDKPAPAEAIRRLVEKGLSTT